VSTVTTATYLDTLYGQLHRIGERLESAPTHQPGPAPTAVLGAAVTSLATTVAVATTQIQRRATTDLPALAALDRAASALAHLTRAYLHSAGGNPIADARHSLEATMRELAQAQSILRPAADSPTAPPPPDAR